MVLTSINRNRAVVTFMDKVRERQYNRTHGAGCKAIATDLAEFPVNQNGFYKPIKSRRIEQYKGMGIPSLEAALTSPVLPSHERVAIEAELKNRQMKMRF